MEASTDLFINIIRNHRIIYDTRSKDFKNVHKKEDEWILIAEESRMTVEAAKKRYNSLRQKHSREKKKEILCSRTKQTFRPGVFYDRLTFLDDYIKPRRTYTNDSDGAQFADDPYDNRDDYYDDGQNGSFYFGDEYSLAQEVADDRETLAQMERDGLLPKETIEILDENGEVITDENLAALTDENQVVIFGETEVGAREIHPVPPNDSGDEPVNLVAETSADNYVSQLPSTSAAYENTTELLQRLASNALNLPSTQPQDSNDIHQRQQPNRFRLMDDPGDHRRSLHLSTSLESRRDCADICPNGKRTMSSLQKESFHNRTSQPNMSIPLQRSTLTARDRPAGLSDLGQFEVPQATSANRNQSTHKSKTNSTITSSSALSKNSPVIQATVSARHNEKTSTQNKSLNKDTASANNMEAIKRKMEDYLNACNEKLQKKPDRSPHARFLAYLGTKMEKIADHKVEALEHEILELVFRYSSDE